MEEQEGARQEPYKANQWTCVHCTFLNGPNALVCDMCTSPKPATAPASSTAETSEVGSAASNREQLACLQCTYLNGSSAAACDVCSSPKPAAALAPGVAAAAVGPVDTKQTAVETMEEQKDEEEDEEDEETAEAKKLSLLCRAGEAKGQQVDEGQAEIEQWACVQCTYLNGCDVSACGMCAFPNSPIQRRGVSVSLLLATYQRWEAAGLAADATTVDVVRDLVKPATADQKCSYVELLARSQDPQDRAGVATATVFLSHAWKYTFKQVVEAIAAHWPDKDNVRSQTFLWFDIFTVNQHQTSTVDPDFWFEAFRENVRTIGRTVLILSPWRNPVPLTRSWCLWEIFCTRLTKASFEICLSPTEVTDFEHTLVKDFDSILGALSRIDVKKAEAGKKEDQEKILALVEGMQGGPHELNKAVLSEMRAWVVQAGRDALKAREGKTDEATLTLMNNLGRLLQDLGDFKGAEEFLRRALEAREKMLGPEHMDTLASVNNLAILLYYQGKLAEAEPLYRRALQGREKTLGAEHPDTLASVNNLGALLKQQGKVAEAEPLYRRALQGREKTLGAEHPHTLASVNNLGNLLCDQGKLAEAEPLYRRALQGREKMLGAKHPDTLASVNNLGVLLKQQGKLAEAEPLFRRALQGQEKTLGADHPSTLHSVNNLGNLLCEQGKVAEAEPLLRRALQGREKTLGAEHPSTLTSVNNLGVLLYQQGKLAEAEPLYRRALQGLEKTLGAEHPHTLTSVYNLGDLLEKQSKLVEAEALYRRKLQGCEKTLGAENLSTLASVKNLARFLEQQGKVSEAEALKRRAQEAKR
eukprot:g62684.t1